MAICKILENGLVNSSVNKEQIRDEYLINKYSKDEISDTPIDIYFPSTIASYTDAGGIHKDKENVLSSKNGKTLSLYNYLP